MGQLKYLAIHCAATPEKFHLAPAHIKKWHLVDNGWSRVGYSDLILRDGDLHNLVQFDQDDEWDNNEMTWGIRGLNGVAQHLCLEGGKDDHGGYKNPLFSFPKLVDPLQTYISYMVLRHPEIEVLGHGDADARKPYCPGFSVREFCERMGLDERNIYGVGS
jgi:N-acetylmuramoyl-L-alanine amidase